MARKAIQKEEPKGARLTLEQLAAYDDVSTDVMVDQAHWIEFREPIRKNRGNKYFALRIPSEAVPKILLEQLIDTKNYEQAEKSLLRLPAVKRYRSSLRSPWDKEQFRRHFRKYIDIYQTDCPFEVSTTNRYTITTYEAAITARRRIKQGETIKYLTGTLVPLTLEESADLDLTHRNFSIVVSSRKKNGSIFLGPARFANHDCEANGRLVPTGNDGMEVKAMKNIEVGEEITVTYGDDYFGPNNEDCLCHSCEKNSRNGWTSVAAFGTPRSEASTPADEDIQQPTGATKKRGYDHDSTSESFTGFSPTKKRKLDFTPSKLNQVTSPPASSTSHREDSTKSPDSDESLQQISSSSSTTIMVQPLQTTSKLSQETSALGLPVDNGIPPDTPTSLSESEPLPQKRPRGFDSRITTPHLDGSASTSPPVVNVSNSAETLNSKEISTRPKNPNVVDLLNSSTSEESARKSLNSTQITENTSITNDPVTIKVKSTEVTKIENASAKSDTSDTSHISSTIEVGIPTTDQSKDQSIASPVTTLPDSFITDNPIASIPRGGTTLKATTMTKTKTPSDDSVLPSVEQSTTTAHLSVRNVSDTIRVPGDYVLTRKLLAQPFDRWVQCRNCFNFTVQGNGYQTRRECPRCERHSKLYGFTWPKTDPDPKKLLDKKAAKLASPSKYSRKGRCGKGTWVVGGGDPDERVLDHRTVHRFLFPDEERDLTRKGLLRAAEDARANGMETPDRALFGGVGGTRESQGRDASDTPDDGRRKSKRFIAGEYGR